MNNCFDCDNCVYVGEGGYFCDIAGIVIDDFVPTENFGSCTAEQKKKAGC